MARTEYREWPAAMDLAADVACLWRGHIGDSGVPYTDRVLPDGSVDVIWDGRRLFVAGPDTRPVTLDPYPNRNFVGIRMHPARAARVLGILPAEIRDRRVDLAELWPARWVAPLTDEIAAAAETRTIGGASIRTIAGATTQASADAGTRAIADAGTRAIAEAFQRVVRRRLAAARPADRVVDALVAALRAHADAGPGLVARVADDLGVSERSLHRRCKAAVGYGPKVLDRVLRFRRMQALARAEPMLGLVALATAAGYADQAHMTRECRRLAGQTPSEWFKTARSGRITAAPEQTPSESRRICKVPEPRS